MPKYEFRRVDDSVDLIGPVLLIAGIALLAGIPLIYFFVKGYIQNKKFRKAVNIVLIAAVAIFVIAYLAGAFSP